VPSYNATAEDLFTLFGRFGPIRYDESSVTVLIQADILCSQIRQGFSNDTKGTAFVVYEEVMDAKQACDKLNGFNFQNRYLVGTQLFSRLPPFMGGSH
jgi:pre-mRNA branch site protein p14